MDDLLDAPFEEEEYKKPFDPALLLPYSKRLEPDDKAVSKIPGVYNGSMSHSVLDADARLS